jgi:hypothetical protein
MSVDSVLQALAAIIAPLIGIVGLLSRRRRLRSEIRDNIALLHEADRDQSLREYTPALNWLRGKITIDIARITGQPLGSPKKPIPKGSLAFSAIIGLVFGAWTYFIVRDGFVWYAVFPGTLSLLMIIAILGMVTDRELPTQAGSDLPPGAVPIRTDNATEQVASALMVKTSDGVSGRFGDAGQVGVAFRFFNAMREGRVLDSMNLADKNWQLCRIQSWLWNNREHYSPGSTEIERLADLLLKEQQPTSVWRSFLDSEANQFIEAWGPVDADALGAASRQRRIARDYELVILAPTGTTGGYFVTTATAIPNAMTFVLHRVAGTWLLASHCSTAPPTPGWPPAWWMIDDPAIVDLPD